MKTYLATLMVVCATFAPDRLLAQINLVQNGSFELNYSFTYWTLSDGGLLNLAGPGAGVQCADGYNAVALAAASTLYQDIPTTIGQVYNFSFYIADWGPDYVPANVVYLNPSFGSTSLGTVSFSGTGKTYQNMGWEKYGYTITADSTTTRSIFYNPSNNRWPMIDNVWVTTVPEPSAKTLIMIGSLAVGLVV